jgi:predicted nicotinamide N-methyase
MIERGTLETGLRKRFDVVEHHLTVAGRTFELRHPRSADDLIDDEAFNRDERLPYWAEVWPSAFVLAEYISTVGARGTLTPALSQREREKKPRLLELGCGCGLAVIAALAAGLEVTAMDYYADALEFVRLNALLNGLPQPEVRVADWRQYPSDLIDFDFVVAADVLYEREYCQLIAAAMGQSLRADGVGIVTDPQRIRAEAFPEACREAGLVVGAPQVFGSISVPGGDSEVCQTVNLFEVRRQQE